MLADGCVTLKGHGNGHRFGLAGKNLVELHPVGTGHKDLPAGIRYRDLAVHDGLGCCRISDGQTQAAVAAHIQIPNHIGDDRLHGFMTAVTIPNADHIRNGFHNFFAILISSLDCDRCREITVPAIALQCQGQLRGVDPILGGYGNCHGFAGE